MAKKQKETTEIAIEKLQVGQVSFWLRGRTPLICAAMSAKAKKELLYPRTKTKADRAQSIKHAPLIEYRESMYLSSNGRPTRILMPSTAFKSAMCNAALEIPGMAKAQIGRLIWVEDDMVPIYGVPQLGMWVVRNSDPRRTPDVRTHAILPQWACEIRISYAASTLNPMLLSRLLETAGLLIAVGDFRQEKGKGSHGQFEVANKREVAAIIKAGGRAAQDKAIEHPAYYNTETAKLCKWYDDEHQRRGKAKAS